MVESAPQPICREVFDTPQMVAAFPPRLSDRNKKVVYAIACPPGCTHSGWIVFSRWQGLALAGGFAADSPTMFEYREDVFHYEPTLPGDRSCEWYVNFAHFDLFCAYGGPAFAQDEMQVAEHPALGSLREAPLASKTILPLTVENGQPTPVLIRSVERRCAVATDRNEDKGRPHGLYGNAFSRAKREVVERATRPIVPPTITNLIAMEAPSYGTGLYRQKEIDYILRTAYTALQAAQAESAHAIREERGSTPAQVVIHTGFWGCGAYGGHRVLMALLQMLASRLAGVHRLVFHTFDRAGTEAYASAERMLAQDLLPEGSGIDVAAVLTKVQAVGFRGERATVTSGERCSQRTSKRVELEDEP